MARRLTSKQIKQIKKMRSLGYSLPEISENLNIGRGTAWKYIQGVKMLPEFEKIWLDKRKSSTWRKINKVKDAEANAKLSVKTLTNQEKLLILACIYWAEGAKIDFNLTNSDPFMILIFTKLIKEVFNISDDRLRLNIRIYEDMDPKVCIKYWLNLTGLNTSNLSSVNVLKGKKSGKLRYGMCRVRVTKGGDMLKYLVAVRNRIVDLSL